MADKKNQIVPVRKVIENQQASQLTRWNSLIKFEPVGDCKLCNCKYKEEAHELYDRTANVKRVHKLLTEDRMIDLSYGAVRNHLKFHYEAHASNQLVQEYSNEVADWLDLQYDQIHALYRGMAIIDREMNVLSAMTEGLPLPERRKTAETVAKLFAILKDSRKTVEELTKARKGVTLVFNQLKIIMQDEMKQLSSEESKKVVQNIFTKLKDSVGHLDYESEE